MLLVVAVGRRALVVARACFVLRCACIPCAAVLNIQMVRARTSVSSSRCSFSLFAVSAQGSLRPALAA
jgi:hypothetical protein